VALPTQRVSEAVDPALHKIHARIPAVRPRLTRSSTAKQRAKDSELSPVFMNTDAATARSVLVESGWQAAGRAARHAGRGGPIWEALKRASDVLGALLLGVVFAPLMIVIALLLRREGAPVIYRHVRIGRDGHLFECLKFRSMVPDADNVLRKLLEENAELKAEWLRDHKLRQDPRITALGRFLRRTSLDEQPQFWNVMRGEMSLVGPRPVVREELLRYGRCIPIYLSAKPGITGLWQVTGRNDTDYRRRVALDVYYVRKQNLLLDLYILLKTTRVVLGGGGAY
jgi:exopolysaccharide production protein ExoY